VFETVSGSSERRALEAEGSSLQISEESTVGSLLANDELANLLSGNDVLIEGAGDEDSVVGGFDGGDTGESEILSGGSVGQSGSQGGVDSRVDIGRQGRNGIQSLENGHCVVSRLDVSTASSGVGEQVVLGHKSQDELDNSVARGDLLAKMSVRKHGIVGGLKSSGSFRERSITIVSGSQ
jgi:hypothetical protein